MVQFSYMMLKLYGKGNFTVESELARQTFKQQASEKLLAVKNVLGHMDTMYWRCDPQNWSAGTNYIQLTKLLQGHIENEVDMNDISTCRQVFLFCILNARMFYLLILYMHACFTC